MFLRSFGRTCLTGLVTGLLLVSGRLVRADESVLRRIETDLASSHPKTVALVIDVSGSMSDENRLQRARKSAFWIVRNVVGVGDRVLVYPFSGSFTTAVDRVVRSTADRKAVLEAIPFEPVAGKGTNIRRAHHRALEECLESAPSAGIVLVTDSYNDQPDAQGPDWDHYRQYYVPGAALDRYPDTPENRAYEDLLARFRQRGGRTYGIGVEIDPQSGRPVERLPKELPSAPITAPPSPSGSDGQATRSVSTQPWVPVLIGSLVLLGVGGLVAWRRPVFLRLDGPGGGKDVDFRLAPGIVLRIGGTVGSATTDAVPVAGSNEEAAVVRLRGRSPELVARSSTGIRVQHNGMVVDAPVVLRDGDEIRVVVENGTAGVARESRWRVLLGRDRDRGGIDG